MQRRRSSYQNRVEEWMNQHARHAEHHVPEVIDQLSIGDDFQQLLFQRTMVSHQTDNVNHLQNDGQKAKQPNCWRWPN